MFRGAFMKAVRIHSPGSYEALTYETVEIPTVKEGEILVRNHAVGVNFIDTYHRSGLYKLPLPAILGREGAGIVEKVGPGVKDFSIGDRVAYCLPPGGSYADFTAAPIRRVVKLPSFLDFRQGAAAMVQGLTAHYLACSSYPLKQGDTALVLAGAGGLGQLLLQIAKLRGARVITTVSTPDKADVVKRVGADDVILYTEKRIDEEVRRITGGKVVYDSVGKSTWEQSLNSLAPLGMLVLCGNASGPVPPIDPLLLSDKGSLFLTRPSLGHYIATPEIFQQRVSDIFGWLQSGKLSLNISKVMPLSQAAEAHRLLESRKTVGKIILIPEGVSE